MPRKSTNPSLWQRFLKLLGFNGSGKNKPNSATSSKPARASEPARARKPGSPSKASTRDDSAKRKPEVVQVTSSRLYVGNLAYSAAESDLIELFNGVGIVTSAEVVYHQRTQRSKGYAFVEMQTKEEALRAVEELHDKDYMGRKLVVSGAKANERKNVA